MIISHNNKFICLNPPKTGTGFREKILLECSDINHEQNRSISNFRHYTIEQVESFLVEKNLTDRVDEYMWVTFVRNPWSRIISWYNMKASRMLRGKFDLKYSKQKPENEELWLDETQYHRDNQSFSKNKYNKIFDDFKKTAITSSAFYKFINAVYFEQVINQRMINWLKFKNRKVDFVGCLETMSDDITKICKQLGITGVKLPQHKEHHILSLHDHIKPLWNKQSIDLIQEQEKYVINLKKYNPPV